MKSYLFGQGIYFAAYIKEEEVVILKEYFKKEKIFIDIRFKGIFNDVVILRFSDVYIQRDIKNIINDVLKREIDILNTFQLNERTISKEIDNYSNAIINNVALAHFYDEFMPCGDNDLYSKEQVNFIIQNYKAIDKELNKIFETTIASPIMLLSDIANDLENYPKIKSYPKSMIFGNTGFGFYLD